MSVDDAESPRSHRANIYCQLSRTYLPPSHLPRACQDATQTDPELAWAWSLVNTLFVSATTLFNTSVFFAAVFLWLVNRQFHLRKKKHSYDKLPLKPLKKPAKALRQASSSLKKAAKRLSSVRKKKVGRDEKQDDLLRIDVQGIESCLSFQSFLDDVSVEDEDDEVFERSLSVQKGDSDGFDDNISTLPESREKKKRAIDLMHLTSKIEVFSYLSSDAVRDILEYNEYVDFKNVGDVVYDTDTLDGSLYAVVSGEVTTNLSISTPSDSNQVYSSVAGPGEVITSMLTLITSLVREYQLQDCLLSSLIPGISRHDSGSSKIVVPSDMSVKAIVTRPNTRLLRIPSRCFVAMLEKYPYDVHNICQTIIARLQRVTIQTLVRFLGLEAGILSVSGLESCTSSAGNKIPEKRPSRTTREWRLLEQSLMDESSNIQSPSTLLVQASMAAASFLGLPIEKYRELQEGASIVHALPGDIICGKGQPPDSVYLILKGTLEVGLEKGEREQDIKSHQNEDHKKAKRSKSSSTSRNFSDVDLYQTTSFKPLYRAAPGNWVGLFSCFTNDASFITARNPEGYPPVLIRCLLDIIDTVGDGADLCTSPSMFLLDLGLDWMHVESGEYISVEGEKCDSMFVVLNGRLRAESSSEGSDTQPASEEFGRGATIGELEALAETSWTQSVYAIRHCEVARIPNQIINILMEMYPSAGLHFARVIASQIHSRKSAKGPANSISSLLPSYSLSLATTAVVSLSENVDVSEFCSYLTTSLAMLAPTKLLTKQLIKERIGAKLLEEGKARSILKVKLTRILGDVEENNRLVVYESDPRYTWWTKLCIQQADCVLVLVDSTEAPGLKRVEELLAWAHEVKNVRCELVVVQSSSCQMVSSAEEHASDDLINWTEKRPWISKQHLVRCDFEDHTQDFHRMGRRITGQSIGLVMGGGGARGLAHLGIVKALNEVGLQVDMVGGTSQGAFVGALLAANPDDYESLEVSAREMAADMANISMKLRDLTFPLTSFFSSHYFNRGIQRSLGNARIQDFVLSFFCVSVDIGNSREVVHTKGLAWKYVRASMSLAGYLPPVSENGSLLVDGGYMNLVPADKMAELGAKKVIAVDVSNVEKCDYYEYGTELSGLWLLWNSWNPFVQTVKVPSMGDINEMLSWVSSERTKKFIIDNKVDLFLCPPVGHYGTLEYDKIDEIIKIGYEYAKPLVQKWAEENGYE
ncbi:hypothetical protein ACHAWF_008166 [Thalassiosira exigua]